MKKQAFTLIEVLIAIILVGLAIASLLGANLAFTRANGSGAQLSTAEFLIEQIREHTVMMTFANLTDTYSTVKDYSWPVGPIGSNGEVLKDSNGNPLYPGYSQKVTGIYLQSTDFTKPWTTGPMSFYRITVEISLNNKTVSSACWIRANY